MVGAFARPNLFKNSVVIPVVINFDSKDQDDEPEDMKPARKEDKPRDVYIKGWMLDEFGYTEDCPGCSARKAGMHVHKPHTTQCRDRIKEALSKDEKGKHTMERVDERW
eukprot:11184715-Lingulodinium_polyedra.AAC.1